MEKPPPEAPRSRAGPEISFGLDVRKDNPSVAHAEADRQLPEFSPGSAARRSL